MIIISEAKRSSALWLAVFLVSWLPSLFLTSPIVEDGLGTMGAAAYLAGHDWSAFLAADGFFYKYGQAFWYILPLLLAGNPVLRYRLMLAVNSLLIAVIPALCDRMLREDLGVEEKAAFRISLLTGLFPSALLYGKYTWAEPMLFVLPWVILRLLCDLAKSGQNIGYSARRCAALAWLAAYAFMCHQRGMVVVVATTISVIFILRRREGKAGKRERRRCFAVYAAHLALALGADRLLTAWVKLYVYAGAPLKYNTLAGFLDPELYRRLFSFPGQQVFWTTVAGWLFHSGMATFGLALTGIAAACGRAVKAVRRKAPSDAEAIVSLQGLLCFLGAFALGVLFFFQTLYGYWNGTDVGRSDHLVFGRYLESSLPVLMMLGLLCLYRGGRHAAKAGTGAAMLFLAIFFAWRIAPAMEGVDCYVHSLMALNLFMDTRAVTMTRDVIPNLPQALILFSALSLCVCGLLLLFYHKRQRLLSVLVLLLFLTIYFRNFARIIYRVDAAKETVYAQYYLTH